MVNVFPRLIKIMKNIGVEKISSAIMFPILLPQGGIISDLKFYCGRIWIEFIFYQTVVPTGLTCN